MADDLLSALSEAFNENTDDSYATCKTNQDECGISVTNSVSDQDDTIVDANDSELSISFRALPPASKPKAPITVSVADLSMSELEAALQHHQEQVRLMSEELQKRKPNSTSTSQSKRKVTKKSTPCEIDFTKSRSHPICELGPESVIHAGESDDSNDEFALPPQKQSLPPPIVVKPTTTTLSTASGRIARSSSAEVVNLREKAKRIGEKLAEGPKSQCTNATCNNSQRCSCAMYDNYFKIRVSTPVVPISTFQQYVGIRQKVRLSEFSKTGVTCDDWVTMAVVVEVGPLRSSNNGCQYASLKLSDLLECQFVVRVMLFGNSATARTSVIKGSVVALLNPSTMKNSTATCSKDKNEMTLKIDNSNNILVLGTCPDYGLCKSRRKTDSRPCSNFVNKSQSEYCDFHLVAASKALAAKRSEFQLASNVPPKAYRKPVQHVLTPRAKTTLRNRRSAHTRILPSNVIIAKQATATGSGNTAEPSSSHMSNLIDVLKTKTPGSLYLVQQLKKANGENQDLPTCATKPEKKMTCRQFLAANRLNDKNKHNLSATNKRRVVDNQNAIGEPSVKRARVFPDLPSMNETDMRQLLERASTHDNELAPEEKEQMDRYFKVMAAKETVEQRATTVMALKCNVVTCKMCDYTSNEQSSLCKRQMHKVFSHTAEKRFFKCRACKKRTVSYYKYPRSPCECGSTTFERVAMRDERKGPLQPRDQLLLRGEERPFLN